MNRILVRKEAEKLLSVRMVPITLVIFLILNAAVISSGISGRSYTGYISAFAREHGVRISGGFSQALQEAEDCEYRQRLLKETAETCNIYESFNAMEICTLLEGLWPMCRNQKLLEDKYRLLQKRTDVLRETGDALDVSAAGSTYPLFSFIFSSVFPLLSAEIMILAAAVSAALTTYEEHTGCTQMIFTKRKGRKLFHVKYTVSLCIYLLMAGILISAVLIRLMMTEDLYCLLHSSVSSQFNVRLITVSAVPFITWIPMDGLQYLCSQCILTVLLGVIVHGACFAAGCRMNNALHVLALFIIYPSVSLCAVLFASRTDCFLLYSLCMMNPVSVWLVQGSWFTDLGIHSLIPMQETAVVCIYLLLVTFVLSVSAKYNMRKDIL